ncbi:MAG: hypothetical protein ABL966_15430, partial [Acidimicrobiales bacterium]
MGLAPAGAALIGAAGQPHALVGGLLCSATFVALGAGRPIGPMAVPAALPGVGVHVVLAAVAARQIAVAGEGSLSWIWIAVVVGLAIAAAQLLQPQRADA